MPGQFSQAKYAARRMINGTDHGRLTVLFAMHHFACARVRMHYMCVFVCVWIYANGIRAYTHLVRFRCERVFVVYRWCISMTFIYTRLCFGLPVSSDNVVSGISAASVYCGSTAATTAGSPTQTVAVMSISKHSARSVTRIALMQNVSSYLSGGQVLSLPCVRYSFMCHWAVQRPNVRLPSYM